jgi:hypothetical protein
MLADLIGFWSHQMLYNSAMQDYSLYFSQRGEGTYAYQRPGICRGAVFTWRLDDDHLTTRTVRQFSGCLGELSRGGGDPFDVREVRVSFSERFAFLLQRQTRVLDFNGGAAHGLGPWRPATLDFAYLRPECPDPFKGQILRAHAYFNQRGGLPRP